MIDICTKDLQTERREIQSSLGHERLPRRKEDKPKLKLVVSKKMNISYSGERRGILRNLPVPRQERASYTVSPKD